MKKFFSIVAAALVSLSMFATDPVVIDFTQNPNNLTANDQRPDITVTVGGVTARLTQASSTSVPMLTPSQMRVYKSAQVEFTSTIGNIKSISFVTDGTSYGADGFGAPTAGTLNGDEWTGDAATVAFPATNHQVRLSTVTIRFEEGYTPPTVTIDTITVSEARARIDAGALGKCYVKGIVYQIDDQFIGQYNNVNCWMTDINNVTDTLEGYKMTGSNNKKYYDASDLEYAAGDTVLFYAAGLKKYNTIYEINEGYFAELLGAGPNHGVAPTMDTLTVAEAMAKGQALADNTESEKVCVIGYAVKLHAAGYDAAGGYQTVFMSDDATATYGDFQAYKCNVAAPGVAQGDKVAVVGKIYKYVGQSGDATIEIKSGDMEVIEHATAIEDIESAVKATKVIENGQMVIIRNGVRFNAAGARL